MRITRSALTIGLLLAGCGGKAADGAFGSGDAVFWPGDGSGDEPSEPPGSNPSSNGVANPVPASPDGIEMRSRIYWRPTAKGLGEFSVALRWVIEEDTFPPERTTSAAILEQGPSGELLLRASELPPGAALVANDVTGRDGFAVAYVMAFVDGNGNGLLDCLNPGECDDVQVGASRNTLVVYAARGWPADGEALFGSISSGGVRPGAGWSLVNLAYGGTRSRPRIREWAAGEAIELAIIGDFRARSLEERRSVMPDVE